MSLLFLTYCISSRKYRPRVKSNVNRVMVNESKPGKYQKSGGSHFVVGSMEAPSINNTTLMESVRWLPAILHT